MRLEIKTIMQDDCTVGFLNFAGFRCATLELPWKDNANDISCIPAGLYNCKKYKSSKHGWCVAIMGVTNRTLVRIHRGNFTKEILGCILVGEYHKDLDRDGITDVANSGKTMEKLMAILPDEFQLQIQRL